MGRRRAFGCDRWPPGATCKSSRPLPTVSTALRFRRMATTFISSVPMRTIHVLSTTAAARAEPVRQSLSSWAKKLSPQFGHSIRSKSTRLTRSGVIVNPQCSLVLRRNTLDLRKIAVRASPVVPVAAIDPYVHDEIDLSLRHGRLLVRLGLDETDHGDIGANPTYRELPHTNRYQFAAKNSQQPPLPRDWVPRQG